MQQTAPTFARLSERVLTVLGLNPGPFTLQGTNTYIVGTGASRLLIDTGEGLTEYQDALVEVLAKENVANISDILLTHHHYDHIGGVPGLVKLYPKVRVWKFPMPASGDHSGPDAESTAEHKQDLGTGDTESLLGGGVREISDGQQFEVEGATVRAVYTPGHTADHVAFFLEEEKAIFSGDCVLGAGTTVFSELHTYMNSLRKLLTLKAKVLFPGHGPVVQEPEKWLHEYIAHRDKREEQIVATLAEHKSAGSLSAMELVQIIYKDVPVNLHPAACKNVLLHLGKLLKEKKVQRESDDKWMLAPKQSQL